MRRTSLALALLFAAITALILTPPSSEGQRSSRLERQTVNGRDVVAREVLVKFREGVRPLDLAEIAADTDAQDVRRIGRAGTLRLRSRSQSAEALVAKLARRADVLYAEPNYIIHLSQTPDDPDLPELWALDVIQAPQAWDLTVGSPSNVVAVIDTGIDYTHPDLAANMWSAPTAFTVTVDGQSITCQAGTHGFNAITHTCNPMDDQGHGTHVSGTIGAVGNNGVGVVGVNWTTQLMGIKFLDAEGSGTTADAIASVEFAIAAKQAFAATGGANIRVVSNSWGGPDRSQALLDQVNAANDADMLFVAGAGNDSSDNDFWPFYPAGFNALNVISVASTGFTDDLSWFSNYGATTVHLGAPGEFIFSTTIGNTYDFASGTSMATPHVSGAAALVLSLCPMNTADLKDTLLGSVDPLPGLAGITVTGGRLNVNSALHACTAPPDTPANLVARGADTRVTLTWSAALGAMRYNVKRSLTPGGPYSSLASGVKTRTYVDTAVVNGTPYYYVVSAENTLGESGDSNEASATPNIPSDLVVFAFTAPAIAGVGSAIDVSVTTKNQGAGTAQPSVTRIYLSDNSALDAADQPLAEQATPELAAGAAVSASFSVVFPDGTAVGKKYLIVVVDADDALDESRETNNRQSRSIQIGPDLVIAALTGPAAAGAGGLISVSDTVRNQGGGDAAASRTTFYLSTNGTIGAGDVLLAGRDVPPLPVNATSAATTTLTIPAATAVGAYYVLAKADGDDAVPEATETNNLSTRVLQVGGDLVVVLTLPATGAAGSPIVVTDAVKNQGAGATDASVTRFYLSVNSVLDAGDTPLAGGRAVPPLDPGVSSTGSTTVVIPPATVAGAYYVFAKADADASVAEINETNNAYGRLIQIGSDLTVSVFTVPAKAAAGASIAVTDTTRNQGGGAAAPSVTRFYLSANAVWDGGDVLLQAGRELPELAAGASSAGSTSLTIPASTPSGAYYFIAKADADHAVIETSETNNALSRAIAVGGDLVVSAFTVPARGGGGLALVVSDTTTNQGAGPVTATATKFYLSTNAAFETSDTFLGSRAVPELADGTGSSSATTVTIPSGINAGLYYLIARADADNAVAETQETNNTLARTVTIGSDLLVSAISTPVTKAAAGSSVAVSETVTNQGGGIAAATVTRFYVSVDGALSAEDILLDASRPVPELPPGASSAGSTSVTIPAGTAPGTVYIFAKADGDDVVGEALETNNTKSRSMAIGPDLLVAIVTVSSTTVAAGTAVNVTDTVVNQGADSAAPSVTRFYLSKNTTLDAADALLSPGRPVAEVVAGGSSAGTTPVTIPSGTVPGAYYLLTKADGDGAVSESLETNNVTLRAIQVTLAP